MKASKAYKFRIYPNTEQRILFAKTFGSVRFVYNKLLEERIDHYNKTGKKLNNTPAKLKEQFVWLKEVDSLALCNAQLHLNTAYSNFFRNKNAGFPKYKTKRSNKFSYTTNNQNGTVRIENHKIKLPKVGFVKIIQHRQIPENWVLKSATVSKTPAGKYFVSLLFEYDNQIPKVAVENIVGLDFSMPELYVASDGTIPKMPHFYRNALCKLKKEQRKLSLMQKDSNNRRKQRIKVARIAENITNQRKDFLHKQSKTLADKYDAIAIEDLNMQALSQALNFGKTVHDNGWGLFVNMLNYKLQEQGKQLIKIDKHYPSSQLCSNCGTQYSIVKDLSIRQWECPNCHTLHDRDINAAINIKKEGRRKIA